MARKGALQSLYYFIELSKKLIRDIQELTIEYDITRTNYPDYNKLGWQVYYID
jgi:hypothetical protein